MNLTKSISTQVMVATGLVSAIALSANVANAAIYSYVTVNGDIMTIEADNADMAIATAPNIDPRSGVFAGDLTQLLSGSSMDDESTEAMDDMDSEMMDGDADMDSTGTTMPATIVDAAVATDDLSTLVTAVTEAELVATLQGEGPFTVFAPVNSAFEALPAGALDTLLSAEGAAQLESILTYHVVAGEYTAADLTNGATLTTVNGDTIEVTTEGGVMLNNNATVVQADIMTGNGVVHIIDAVLMPSE